VRTNYLTRAGHNELLVSIPYWWPAESAKFSEEETRAFYEEAWQAPKVAPLIGPLKFDTR
jgi:hypothetical protein